MCGVALLALTVGVADVHGREAAAIAVTAARGYAMPPSGEAPVRTPVSLRAAAPMRDDTAARPQGGAVPIVSPTPDPPAAPSRTLVLLSAFGAMALLIGRHLRRER
jgi:hypothetical protein